MFVIAVPMFAGTGQSLRLNGSQQAANTSVAAVGGNSACRVEWQFVFTHNPASANFGHVDACGLFMQWLSADVLFVLPDNTSGGSCTCALQISGTTSSTALIRYQQVPSGAGGSYTLNAWDGVTGAFINSYTGTYTSTSGSHSNGAYIGSTTGQDTTWGFFRVFSTTLTNPSAQPPLFSAMGDILNWTLNGTLADTSGNNYTASGVSPAGSCGSAPCYIATAAQPFVKAIPLAALAASEPVWAANYAGIGVPSWNTNGTMVVDCTQSYSQDETSGSVTCAWTQNSTSPSQPSTLTFVTPGGSTSTVTGAIPTNATAADYSVHLVATDVSMNTGSANIEIGAVAVDSNGVVAAPSAAVTKAFGPQIGFGYNPWGYMDERSIAAMQLQIANNPYLASATWLTTGAGTIKYPFAGKGIAPGKACTTITSTITSSSTSIAVADATCLSGLASLPTVVMLSQTASQAEFGHQEAIRICSTTGTTGMQTLGVCYDGRGIASSGFTTPTVAAQGWNSGATIGEMRIAGASTLFATDSQRALAPAGVPGPIGPIVYSTGTAGEGADLTHILGSGTTWTTAGIVTGDNHSTIRIAATHGGGTPFIWWSPITTVTDNTHLVVSRPLPSDIDGGTFSYAITGEMYMSLEFSSAGGLWRGLFYNVDCESETACFGLANKDIGAFDTACCTTQTGLKYSYKLTLGAASALGPNFYGTGLAAREFYYRSGWTPALTFANQIDENWTRDPEICGGYCSSSPLLYGGGAVGGIIDKALNASTVLNWYDVTPWGSVQGTSYAAHGCNQDDARDSGYPLSWMALLDLYDTGDSATWDPVMVSWASRENDCRRPATGDPGHDGYSGVAANSWAAADVFSPGQFTYGAGGCTVVTAAPGCTAIALTLTNGQTAFTPTVASTLTTGMCAGVDDGSGTIMVTNGSATATVVSGSVSGSGIRIWITDNGSPVYSAPFVYSISGSTVTLGALWPGLSGTFHFMVEDNSLSGNFDAIGGDAAFVSADTVANNTILQETWACHYTDANHAQLHRVWDNSTASTWHISVFNVEGFKVQPYMLGIKRAGLYWGSESPNGSIAASFATLLPSIGNWMGTYGTNDAGSPYARVMQACEPIGTPPIGSSFLTTHGAGDGSCGLSGLYYLTASNPEAVDRVHNAEAGSAILSYYLAAPGSGTRAVVDTFYGQMFGYCPYTSGGGATYYCDAHYINAQSELANSGGNCNSLSGCKWTGYFFGIGGLFTNSWPAIRAQTSAAGGSISAGKIIQGGKTVRN